MMGEQSPLVWEYSSAVERLALRAIVAVEKFNQLFYGGNIGRD